MARRGGGYDEPNYTQTPNLLFDLHLPDMGYGELKVMLVVVRDTFGWHRTATEPLSLSRLQKRTGLGRKAVVDGIAAATDRGVLRRRPAAGGSYVYEAVISEQLALGASSITEPASSTIEPAASAVVEPGSVGLSNQEPVRQPNPSKRKGLERKRNDPPTPLHEVWEAAIEGFGEERITLMMRECRLVSVDPLVLDGPSAAVNWLVGARREAIEAALA